MVYKNYNVLRGTIDQYIDLLLTWNKKINLVSIKSREELVERHILDSLQLLDYIDKDQVVFDIGSGAGFPGLFLSYGGVKKVNLVEVVGKKASFLITAAALSNNQITVHNQAVENIKADYCDVITARGFASLDNIFTLTKSVAQPQTKYILQKGKNIEVELKKSFEKWKFRYIIHQSKTSSEASILEIDQLEKK